MARRCPRPGVGVRADHTGSQNATRRAKEKVTARNYISRQNTIVQESVQWVPWPGPARRRGRGVSDGGRPPVGGRFRQPDRTPFLRLTPAFGLRSLRKNDNVLPCAEGKGRTTFFPVPKSGSAINGWPPTALSFQPRNRVGSGRMTCLFFCDVTAPLDKTRGSGSHPAPET